MTRTGILLIGHGTRDPRGIAEFMQLVKQTRRQAEPMLVEPGFLELASPTIMDGVERLALLGVNHVIAVPVLLFAAGHAKHDIPRILGQASRQIFAATDERIQICQADHLGCHNRIVDLAVNRFHESRRHESAIDQNDVLLVMVGRGSQDESATSEMFDFARLCQKRIRVCRIDVCFIAMAEPGFETTLNDAAQSRFREIIVQPHLLFQGNLLDRLQMTVNSYQSRSKPATWRIVPHLGPDRLLIEAIIDRAMSRLV